MLYLADADHRTPAGEGARQGLVPLLRRKRHSPASRFGRLNRWLAQTTRESFRRGHRSTFPRGKAMSKLTIAKEAPDWHAEAIGLINGNFSAIDAALLEAGRKAIWLGLFLNRVKRRGKRIGPFRIVNSAPGSSSTTAKRSTRRSENI
jgi:hypothetical protein